jgi:type II secretory pathway pseudopilin PulG
MSLVEVTIILMILALLSASLEPAMTDYVAEARHTKAKEDIEAIGVSIMRLTRDVGGCIKFTPTTACTMANRVDILFSAGPDVVGADLGSTSTDFASAGNIVSTLNWSTDAAADIGDSMADQLADNVPNYDTPAETIPTGYTIAGPMAGLGWRGAYLPADIGPDPWGRRYLSNVVFLTVATDATDDTTEGARRGGWSRDVVVISSGANRSFDSPFGGSANFGVGKLGDDLVYIVGGDTR